VGSGHRRDSGHRVNHPLIGDPELEVATPVNCKHGDDVIIMRGGKKRHRLLGVTV
jgi:hypothetical protein